jgi:hypothetical protein
VFGVKFRPGGFTAATGYPAAALADQAVPLRQVFGRAADDITAEVLSAPADEERIQVVDAFLRHELRARDDEAYELVLRMVSSMLADRSITRVSHIASQHDVSVRTVQRLFGERDMRCLAYRTGKPERTGQSLHAFCFRDGRYVALRRW